jgi:hypothetical protein
MLVRRCVWLRFILQEMCLVGLGLSQMGRGALGLCGWGGFPCAGWRPGFAPAGELLFSSAKGGSRVAPGSASLFFVAKAK